ncbi:MAG TPA: SBBP repeat-containing protein [Thermoanaerobaculia bacterium]|nr:SBBP repeat-containing protein [Thermoanaerobaculia bacterium]
MSRTSRFLSLLSASLMLGAALHAQPSPDARVRGLGQERTLSFEENRGQTDSRVKYLARTGGWSLFLTPTEAVLGLQEGGPVRLSWTGGSTEPRIRGEEELPGKVNYLTGDASRWRSGIPTYSRVRYSGIYPGIDLVFYGNGGRLEYDVIVAPGADPGTVRLGIAGADRLSVDQVTGDLVLALAGSEMRLSKPVSYQDVGGARREVASRYRLLGPREVGFEVAEWDRERPLIIDPVLAYSTYLGGSADDGSYGGTADAQGNLYVTGSTSSPDFPLASAFQISLAGNYDVFVTKLDRDGVLVYSTYLGGSDGEQGEDMAADDRGNVYLAGSTHSADFPRVGGLPAALAGGTGDAFVTKLGAGGEILFSTLLGGSTLDSAEGIGVDARGRIYVAGWTYSADFPIRGALFGSLRGPSDGYVARLSSSGTELEASTYLGGSEYEYIQNLAVDPAGNVHLVGSTTSRDFPVFNPPAGTSPSLPFFSWGFLAKLPPSLASFVYSTYFASGIDVAADASGNTYVIGLPNQPVPPDACATKLDPQGAVLFSTCVGGSNEEMTTAIEVDRQGNTILAGSTYSTDFPLKDPIQSRCVPLEYEGRCYFDIFVTKLDPAGQEILFSTYLGGTQQVTFYPPEEGVYGLGVDARGDIYLAGWTYSADFPTVNAVQPEHGGGSESGEIDALAVRISFGGAPPDCSAATAGPSLIWPPNGRMVPVSILGVTDPDGGPVTLQVTGVTQDEPGAAFSGIGSSVAQVKAERNGQGDGRVYRIEFQATDPSGASCTGQVTVCVPHDQGEDKEKDGAP